MSGVFNKVGDSVVSKRWLSNLTHWDSSITWWITPDTSERHRGIDAEITIGDCYKKISIDCTSYERENTTTKEDVLNKVNTLIEELEKFVLTYEETYSNMNT